MGVPNVISVSSSKGGVGKSSLATGLAALVSMRGYRTLFIDMDPSAGAGFDLGIMYSSIDDDGAGLLESLKTLAPLNPTSSARPNLDVIVGGTKASGLGRCAQEWRDKLGSEFLALRHCLEPVRGDYDLVVIDTAPGEESLAQELALAASQYVVIPTRTDEASIDGIGGVGMIFDALRQVGTPQLLAVVPFGVNPSATKVLSQVRSRIQERLPDGVLVTESCIRYAEKAAVASRAAGLVMVEYARDVAEVAPKYWESGGKDVDVARSASKVANDYIGVTSEILGQLHAVQAQWKTESLNGSYAEAADA